MARSLYPALPRGAASLRGALHGAAKLGLVALQADRASLTFTGRSVAALLPPAPEMARIHGQLETRRRGVTLASLHPQIGAVLRLLLGADPVARLLFDTLQATDAPLSMRALVLLSAERDRALAAIVFFKPESVPAVTGEDGQILWHRVQPQHFRSTRLARARGAASPVVSSDSGAVAGQAWRRAAGPILGPTP